MGNRDIVAGILGRIPEQANAQIDTIRELLAAEDTDGVARVAHGLKGTAANVSAGGLRSAAEALEEAARRGDVGGSALWFIEVQEELRRYVDYIAKVLEGGADHV